MWFRRNTFISALAIFLLISVTSMSHSDEIFGVGTLDDKYTDMTLNGQYVDAFNYLSKPKSRDAKVALALHYLIGSGTEVDKCKAVKILENNYSSSDAYLQLYLNIAYHSSWKTIAALEGSPDASREMGMYYYRMTITPNTGFLFFLDARESLLRNAYIHFKRAIFFGDKNEGRGPGFHVERILKVRPDFEETVIVDYSKTSIICPIREKK